MLHSSMSSKEQWLKLLSDLSPSYHAIAIDLYGYGESDYPPNSTSFSLMDEVTRINTIITQLIGADCFHLVGHSYGAATALRFAFAYPQRVLSLSIFEPVAFHLLDKDDPVLTAIIELACRIRALTEQQEFSQATRMFVDFWSGIGTYDSLSATRQDLLDDCIHKVILDFQAGISEPLTLDSYKKINIPVCLIASPQSPPPTRQIAVNLESTLPNLVVHRVEGGHMAPMSNAPAVNRVWKKFIETQ